MRQLLSIIVFFLAVSLYAQEIKYTTATDIPYYSAEIIKSDDYIGSRCVLDVYYPEGITDFPTVVWFHGGGLMYGEKVIPESLKNQGIGVVAVNYRLNPQVTAPKYLEDAAAAVAWTFNNIHKFGGDPTLIFVSGHSAGGYLTSMIGLDKRWLQVHDIDANRIAGLIPFSGNAITHMTIRKERGIAPTQAIIDDLAPIYHVREDAPPLLLITGDRELEIYGRYEENAYFMRMMKVAGHKDTRILELAGYDHMMLDPAFPLLLKEVDRIVEGRKK